MQPKNAFQRKAVAAQKRLKPLTEHHINWGLENCFEYIGTQTKHKAGCLECGHVWNQENTLLNIILGCECPKCGKELKMRATAKKEHKEVNYCAVLTTIGGFQVVRMMYLTKYCKLGRIAHLKCTEVMQHWIDEKGRFAVFAKNVNGLSGYYDSWVLSSNLELKAADSYAAELRNTIVPSKIYPKRKVLNLIKRNGFKGHFYNIAPGHLFKMLLTDSKAETLIKSNQASLLKYYYDRRDSVGRYWSSIKICIRNKYIIKDAPTWTDYLHMLSRSNKDLLNSHYICPIDLKRSHDRLVEKYQRTKIEQTKKSLQVLQFEYEKQKGKFFGIQFSNNEITIKVLETVEEFKQESELLKHCLFGGAYYNRANSLILSARIKDKPVETIELSLSSLKILQSRGAGNKATKYHEEIINLVNSNLGRLAERL